MNADHCADQAELYYEGLSACRCLFTPAEPRQALLIITGSTACLQCPACLLPIFESGELEEALHTIAPIPVRMSMATRTIPAHTATDGHPEPPEQVPVVELTPAAPWQLCELPHTDIEEEDLCDLTSGWPPPPPTERP